MKLCPACKTHKDAEHFYRDKTKPTGLSSFCKPCQKTCSSKNYFKKHEEGKEARRRYSKNLSKAARRNYLLAKRRRYRDNPATHLAVCLRSRLQGVWIRKEKGLASQQLLGCTYQQLVGHLEAQFKPGMTWENKGKDGWHIDHIRPLASFDLTDPEQLHRACHYTNLQPLWARDNLSKGAKQPDGGSEAAQGSAI